MQTKRCSRCKQELPATEFHINKRPKWTARGWRDTGLSTYCKECRAAWVDEHSAHISHYNTEYYRLHRARRIQQVRDYQRKNPEVKRAAYNSRRARKKAAVGSHTAQDLRAIYNSQGGCCFYCGRGPIPRREGHFDHFIPLARGGGNGPQNIVFACEPCNRAKHTRTPEEFAEFQRLQKTDEEA